MVQKSLVSREFVRSSTDRGRFPTRGIAGWGRSSNTHHKKQPSLAGFNRKQNPEESKPQSQPLQSSDTVRGESQQCVSQL